MALVAHPPCNPRNPRLLNRSRRFSRWPEHPQIARQKALDLIHLALRNVFAQNAQNGADDLLWLHIGVARMSKFSFDLGKERFFFPVLNRRVGRISAFVVNPTYKNR